MSKGQTPLLVIAGPTASGKTALAVEISKRIQGEVISADSMQIYEDLQVGTARPSTEEMQGIPHHLQGFLPLSESYSVAQYAVDARNAIEEIENRKHFPVLCGGTGLYIQSITENIHYSETKSDEEYRNELRNLASQKGGRILLDELNQIDPESAIRLHENDIGRIIRALEVYHLTGKTMTEMRKASKMVASPYKTFYVVLDYKNREILYSRIDKRVDLMMQNGLLNEAEKALHSPYAPTALQAIGYKELAPYIEGLISLEEAVDNLKRATRRYAKRQLSWFRHVESTYIYYVDEYLDLNQLTEAVYKDFLVYFDKEMIS